MFETISRKLETALQRLRSKGRLSEADVSEALREVRLALLEGDVHYQVVADLLQRVRAKVEGAELQRSIDPAQLVVKAVHDELVATLGGQPARLKMSSIPPTIVFLVGLQGSGKTTTAGKLAVRLRRDGRRPILVACDLQRPAAVEQLRQVAAKAQVPIYAEDPPGDPVEVANRALEYVRTTDRDVMVVDTAGRLAVDDQLMRELALLKEELRPHAVLLVVDAMTGQDAVNVATQYVERVGIDGVILSKLDGDARGGAAISVRAVSGAPIYFAGVGERLEDLEVFYPDRMAGRILGMGDVATLVEKAQAAMSPDSTRTLQEKILGGAYDLEDFLTQMRQLRGAGPLGKLLSLLPGIPGIGKIQESDVDEREIARLEAIILSMTPEERRNPKIIDGSRKRRIARGSGVDVSDVNVLLQQFSAVQAMMRQLGAATRPGKLRRLAALGLEGFDPAQVGLGAGAPLPGGAPKRRPPKSRSKKKKRRK